MRDWASRHGRRLGKGKALAAACAVLAAGAGLALLVPRVEAQGWPGWPWSQPQQRPQPIQPQRPQPIQPQNAPQRPGAPMDGMGTRERYCLQLEQELARDWMTGQQGRSQLPRIEEEMRKYDRQFQGATRHAEQRGCYEYFLFSKSLKGTPECLRINKDIEEARRKLAELNNERSVIMNAGSRGRQDEIVSALARNGCGQNYQQEAAKRSRESSPFGFLWQGDEEGGGSGGMRQQQQGALPFATYRTVCVRLCDGYYFPISYSTMQSRFPQDANVCQQKCAAPAELFYHQNPGGDIEQAISFVSQQPYTKLPNALRHRKEFVQGCSCKMAEFQPELFGKHGLAAKRAEASSSPPQRAGAPPGGREAPRGPAIITSEPDGDDQIGQTIERSNRRPVR